MLDIGITELFRQIVASTAEKMNYDINYIFGNADYIKEQLDEYSHYDGIQKLPMIALFCPITESRGLEGYESTASVSLIIACSTTRELTNEQREDISFRATLRPIYHKLLESLKEDHRLDFGYRPIIRHEYSENYSYGKYGAYTATDKELSEPIDAIDIRNLELKIKEFNTCRNE